LLKILEAFETFLGHGVGDRRAQPLRLAVFVQKLSLLLEAFEDGLDWEHFLSLLSVNVVGAGPLEESLTGLAGADSVHDVGLALLLSAIGAGAL
jgi:hypothetical protein